MLVVAMTNGGPSPNPENLRTFVRAVYEADKVVGETGREFSLHPHGVPERDGEALRDLAIREGAARTIETGFCYGLSTLFLCEAVLAGGAPEAHHVAMDPRQPTWDHAGLRTVRDAGAADLVEFHPRGSEFVLPEFVSDARNFDFAFIDGDHRFEGAFVDLYYLTQLVKPGGVIVVDDVWMPAVRLAVSYFVNNFGLEVEPVALAGAPYTGTPAIGWQKIRPGTPGARMAVLRTPLVPPKRRWDHFVPFADWDTGRTPPAVVAAKLAAKEGRALLRRVSGRAKPTQAPVEA